MSFQIVRNDITRVKADVIVNTANPHPVVGSGTDSAVYRAAGEERAKRALLEHRAITSRVTLDNLFESLKEGELKEVNVIIKADVQGSAEALPRKGRTNPYPSYCNRFRNDQWSYQCRYFQRPRRRYKGQLQGCNYVNRKLDPQ